MNEIFIEVDGDIADVLPLETEHLTAFAHRVLSYLQVTDKELSVTLTGDEVIRELNRSYRGRDEATDVLSFSQSDEAEDEQESFISADESLLGDLIISVETLKRNAQYFTVPVEQELRRLIIHGILHLTGMDHATNDPSEQMLQYQEEILSRVQENHAE